MTERKTKFALWLKGSCKKERIFHDQANRKGGRKISVFFDDFPNQTNQVNQTHQPPQLILVPTATTAVVYFFQASVLSLENAPPLPFVKWFFLSNVHDEMMNVEPSKAGTIHLWHSSTDWLRQQQDSDHSLHSNQQLPLQVSIKHWFFSRKLPFHCWEEVLLV